VLPLRAFAFLLCPAIALPSIGCSVETSGLADVDGGQAPPTDATARDVLAFDVAPIDAPPPPDGGPTDTTPVVDATRPCETFVARHFPACAIPEPSPLVEVTTSETYDTTDGSGPLGEGLEIAQAGGVAARLVSLDGFRITASGSLRVVGSMPLIVASFGTIDIDGTLDVSSVRGGTAGAGADRAGCSDATSGEYGTSGSGGGGGGGFRGRGGDGGDADLNGPVDLAGGVGGGVVLLPDVVRGGCRGADSGGTDRGAAIGGAGGGAVQLTARDAVSIAGTVHAGGAGGTGGPSTSAAGGGGGGSGGYIGIEATMVTITGTLAANGGGGGEGTDRSLTGADGEDGRSDDTRARGGWGSVAIGTDGGDGAARGVLAGADVPGISDGGGGGGGGGGGFILIWADVAPNVSTAVISPSAMITPR
jgi:hypothetical protein